MGTDEFMNFWVFVHSLERKGLGNGFLERKLKKGKRAEGWLFVVLCFVEVHRFGVKKTSRTCVFISGHHA